MPVPEPVAAVSEVLERYPAAARRRLLAVRRLIFETAAELEGVGPLTETTKWGEPAYLTANSKSGTTIRFAWRSSCPKDAALFFNCNTTLVSDFRAMFEGVLRFEGNRAVRFALDGKLPKGPLKACIAAALTYHAEKRRNPGRKSSSARVHLDAT